MTKATRSAIDTAVKDKAVNPISASTLEFFSKEWDPEAPDAQSSERSANSYGKGLGISDPNGVDAMRSAVMIYGERDL